MFTLCLQHSNAQRLKRRHRLITYTQHNIYVIGSFRDATTCWHMVVDFVGAYASLVTEK
jgi:hypothetical protein